MLKTFAIALLAIAMFAGLAQAAATFSLGMARQGHKHTIPGCTVGQQAAVTCACGKTANGKPLLRQKGTMVPLSVHECLHAIERRESQL